MTEQRDAVLARSDLPMVRDEIVNLHRMFKDQAAKDGSTVAFKTEYVNAWYAFRDGPTVSTARVLLDNAPQLLEYFEMCCPGHDFYERTQFLRDRGVLR
jgi:hypothetical protein